MTLHRYSPAVTGIGAVSCAGVGVDALWSACRDLRSGIGDEGLGRITESHLRELPHSFSGPKSSLIAVNAIREAMAQAGWDRLGPEDGLIIATTVGQIEIWENALMAFLKKELSAEAFAPALQKQSLAALLESLSEALSFRGRSLLFTSACSAATQAIAMGALWVQQRRVRRCLVGGVEVLSRLTVEGFRSLQLLSSEPCRPFDEKRQGINLSEAAAFLCLEAVDEARHPLALISGSGMSTDAYHMAAPEPAGRGSLLAMQQALQMAGLSLADISWVHAHGTGSPANDSSEGQAFQSLFSSKLPYVTSTKGIHGHSLGASGALETVLCTRALREGLVLKTAGLAIPDPKIALRHPEGNEKVALRHILKNTLGFGGNNAALLLSAVT